MSVALAAASLVAPVDLLAPAPPAPTAAAGYGAGKIHQTAQAFEASFLQTVLGSMFSGDSQQASAFGGGEAEGQFRSFLTEAIAKGVTRRGGIGLAPVIERELLKLQATHTPATGAQGTPSPATASAPLAPAS